MQTGFSILELLVVLVVLGVLLGIGVTVVRPPAATVYSNDVRALIQQARFEAIKRNVPVAIRWDAEGMGFVAGLGPVDDPCAIVDVVARAATDAYPRVVVDPGFPEGDGLVWLPSGQARACDYGTFVQTIAYVEDGRVEREITVTLTGRVTIQ